MPSSQENSKRIAKNTIIMYVRMFVMMLIGLYTSRVIINTLGLSDYGINNVVGGLVAMFSIASSSLSSSISRFLTFEIGRKDKEKLKEVFSTSIIAQFCISVVIVILIEIVGVWFLNQKMNIPNGRMEAANFVLQCSIISFALGLNNAPYGAAIIAHERFGVFAYLTIFDAVSKLVVVFALYISPFDKLETYSFLLLIVTIVVQFVYFIYCRKNFDECHFELKYNPSMLKEIGSFSGWSFFGNASWILNNQGIDILINLFFGVTLNAARGVANQVNSIVQNFVANFMTTLNPQITKSYASNDFAYMHKLIYSGAKYSYFLMLFFSIPLCLETKYILVLWLKIVPDYAVPFVRFTLLSTMAFVLGNTLTTSQNATGEIRKFAIVTSLFTFLEFPLTYFFFNIGLSPISCYFLHFSIYFFLVFVKIYLVRDLIHISYHSFFNKVLLKVSIVTIVSLIPPLLIYCLTSSSITRVCLVCIVSFLSSCVSVFYLGMEKNERMIVINILRNRLSRR